MKQPILKVIDFYRKYGKKSNFQSISDISFNVEITESLIYDIENLNKEIEESCEQKIIEEIETEGKIIRAKSISNSNITLGKEASFRFESVSIYGAGYIYYSIDNFLNNNKIAIPDFYYISEIDYLSSENTNKPQIETYNSIVKLIETVTNKDGGFCDYNSECSIENTKKIVIFGEKRIEFDTIYTSRELEIDNTKINDLIRDIEAPNETAVTHKKEKSQILKKSIVEITKHINKDSEKFSHLLNHIDELRRDYNNGLDLYLNEFSFSKFISDLSEKKIAFIEKINKIVSDIGLKLLFLPLIGAATRITTGAEKLNFSLPIIMYTALMMVIIIYTVDSLGQISEEIKNSFHHKKYKKSILTSGDIDQELFIAHKQLTLRIGLINLFLLTLYLILLIILISQINENTISDHYINLVKIIGVENKYINFSIITFSLITAYFLVSISCRAYFKKRQKTRKQN